MVKKTKIAVIFGGQSTEYDISLKSTEYILSILNKEKYDIVKIGITREGKWLLYNGKVEKIVKDTWADETTNKKVVFSAIHEEKNNIIIIDEDKYTMIDVDVVFPILHGLNGEDGAIQGIFETSGIPFVGCGVLASALCMDKISAHAVLDTAGIKTAKYVPLYQEELKDLYTAKNLVLEKLSYPIYIKPSRQGSSIGVNKANNDMEFLDALEIAKSYDSRVLAEESLEGQEVEIAVMGNEKPIVSGVGEIIPSTEFYDYESKYMNDSADLLLDARISDAKVEEIKNIAKKAYKVLNCKGLSRIDFFVLKDGTVVLNEVNTLPGFTNISMYPRLFIHSGMSGEELIDKLISYAFEGMGK